MRDVVLNDRWLDYPAGHRLTLSIAETELLVGRGLATEISPDEPLGEPDDPAPLAPEGDPAPSADAADAIATEISRPGNSAAPNGQRHRRR